MRPGRRASQWATASSSAMTSPRADHAVRLRRIRRPLTLGGRFRAFPSAGACYLGAMKLKAIIHEAEEGGYWAEVPALPGCVTQAETREELEKNLREAIEAWLTAGEGGFESEPKQQILEVAV